METLQTNKNINTAIDKTSIEVKDKGIFFNLPSSSIIVETDKAVLIGDNINVWVSKKNLRRQSISYSGIFSLSVWPEWNYNTVIKNKEISAQDFMTMLKSVYALYNQSKKD